MPASIDLKTSASYPTAGVQFNLILTSAAGPDQASLNITVDDLASGNRLSFSHASSAAAHHFTIPFSRWLNTKGFQATRNEDEIIASAKADVTESQLIKGFQDALDMVDQKFSNYLSSILGSDNYSDVVYKKEEGLAWLLPNPPET